MSEIDGKEQLASGIFQKAVSAPRVARILANYSCDRGITWLRRGWQKKDIITGCLFG